MIKFTYTKDQVELVIRCYHYANNQVAMIAYHAQTDELWLDVTVSIPTQLLPGEIAIKGYDAQESLVQDLIDANIILAPSRTAQSGFVKIPIAQLLIAPVFEKEDC